MNIACYQPFRLEQNFVSNVLSMVCRGAWSDKRNIVACCDGDRKPIEKSFRGWLFG
jgi:hypothetical protein